jgi:hypothetical protein
MPYVRSTHRGRLLTNLIPRVLGFSHVVSDDGRFAIVEFLASDTAAFAPLLNDKLIKAFQHGVDKKDDIEKEL